MKTHAIFFAALALGASACSEQEPAQPEEPMSEQNVPAETAAEQLLFDEAFVEHMHDHADKLDELMFALADGNLEDAMTPAYWLSRHETVDGVPQEWQQYVTNMRGAAMAVESAGDLEAARAAAEQISRQCQACHEAAGINSG